jgi:hypothetical protein
MSLPSLAWESKRRRRKGIDLLAMRRYIGLWRWDRLNIERAFA